jgi:hypothetical protein
MAIYIGKFRHTYGRIAIPRYPVSCYMCPGIRHTLQLKLYFFPIDLTVNFVRKATGIPVLIVRVNRLEAYDLTVSRLFARFRYSVPRLTTNLSNGMQRYATI